MSKLYVVQRRTWFHEYAAYEDSDCIKGSGVPVAAFATRKAADAHAKQLEQEARSEASSPFLLLVGETFDYGLDITEEQMCAAVRELGLEPPVEVQGRWTKYYPWPRWYDGVVATLTPGQFAGLWELFKKLKVYQVVEVPVEE